MLFQQINVPVVEPNPLIISTINQIKPIIIKQIALMINIISEFANGYFLIEPFLHIDHLKLLYIFKYGRFIEITCHRR